MAKTKKGIRARRALSLNKSVGELGVIINKLRKQWVLLRSLAPQLAGAEVVVFKYRFVICSAMNAKELKYSTLR